jgi:hypothetical protein
MKILTNISAASVVDAPAGQTPPAIRGFRGGPRHGSSAGTVLFSSDTIYLIQGQASVAIPISEAWKMAITAEPNLNQKPPVKTLTQGH